MPYTPGPGRKLIFLDVDGTLVVPGRNDPPASALQAIRAAQAKGNLVAVCSGRCRGMLAPLQGCGFDALIASAGGRVEHRGRVLFDCPMTPAQQQRAMHALHGAQLRLVLEALDTSYADPGAFDGAPMATALNSEMARWELQRMGVQPMETYRGEAVYKISFMASAPRTLAGAEMDALRQEFNFCLHEPGTFGAFNGEIINKKFNKGTAIELLCRELGIPLADTVAFGDSMNDCEMLHTAALGVCMGNGSEALKAEADAVCGRVEEDGLARAFAQWGLV